MTAAFQRNIQLTACYKNKLTGTGHRCNKIHATRVAHQTANWCFDFETNSQTLPTLTPLPSPPPHLTPPLCSLFDRQCTLRSSLVPLMPAGKEADVVALWRDLDDLGRPVAESLLLREHQLVGGTLQHARDGGDVTQT